jgi:hypothetical protein
MMASPASSQKVIGWRSAPVGCFVTVSRSYPSDLKLILPLQGRSVTQRRVIANVRSHLPGERLSMGHVNRYVSDGIVVVAELQSK